MGTHFLCLNFRNTTKIKAPPREGMLNPTEYCFLRDQFDRMEAKRTMELL